MAKKQIYYMSITDDVIDSANQDLELADDYRVFRPGWAFKVWNAVARTLAAGFAWIYCRGILGIRVYGKEKLATFKKQNQGYFIFGNHTQMLGDPFNPLTIVNPYRFYTLAAQSNWGIPILGKFVIPVAGLPVGKTVKQSIRLLKDVKTAFQSKHAAIIIYPEAHLWPYYTKIRPFPATSLNFPVSLKAPSFTMTTTYQKPAIGRRPKIRVYIDGPFFPDQSLGKKAAQEQLHAEIYQAMCQRAKLSDYAYWNYVKINSEHEHK
ncbi:1-acyl-sn-glycerol-3-phosphate acyltransferase [uncultured Lactobacillus sp.]|uniref:lysophospholipid acyltransferase family protein n=1 Tax=uncultured Lactobacillus sp. TaxID=153152 RepID=UPI002665ED47|nr:1-acyl-sn-glycerol-3-phosphate acyltransferase [uncultured Lactobacillus sp.]